MYSGQKDLEVTGKVRYRDGQVGTITTKVKILTVEYAAAIGGAGFVVLADAGARVLLAPAELPVGVLTALAGGPFFLFLFLRRLRDR